MSIKTLLLALAALAVAVPGFAREEKTGDQPEKASSGKSAEVVAVDAEAKSITVKGQAADAAADPETLVVEGKALASLKDFAAGDKVVITCKESVATSSQQAQPAPDASSTRVNPCVVTEIARAPEK